MFSNTIRIMSQLVGLMLGAKKPVVLLFLADMKKELFLCVFSLGIPLSIYVYIFCIARNTAIDKNEARWVFLYIFFKLMVGDLIPICE